MVTKMQVEAVLEMYKGCVAQPGVSRKIQTAHSGIPFAQSYVHLDTVKSVCLSTNNDECLRVSLVHSLALFDGQLLQNLKGQHYLSSRELLELGYPDLLRKMRHFVTHVEETIPGLTLHWVYESNGAHLYCPWTYVFHNKVGDFLVAMRCYGLLLISIRVDMCG